MTDTSGKALRRTNDNVLISGMAVMLLGVWSAVKLCVNVFLRRQVLVDEFAGNEDVSLLQLFIVTAFVTVLVAFFGMSVHLYIGFSARALALDRKIKPPFLIISALLLFVTVSSALYSLIMLFDTGNDDAERASLIIDGTLIFALLNLIVSTVKLRKMRRKSVADTQDTEESSHPENV